MKVATLQEHYKYEQMKMLIEQLDEAELKNIARAFDRIDNILGPHASKLPSIDGPLEKARQELASMMSGEGGILKRLFRGLTNKQERAMKSVMETQIQLVSLFRMLPSIMTIAGKNVRQNLKQAQSIRAVRQGEPADEETGLVKKTTVADAVGDASKNMMNMIAKGLKPAAIGAYPINAKQAANDLMSMKVDDFADLARRAGSAELRVPIPKEDMEHLQAKGEQEPGGRAQELLQNLIKGDKTRAKAMKGLLDQLEGLQSQDLKMLRKGLDKALGGGRLET